MDAKAMSWLMSSKYRYMVALLYPARDATLRMETESIPFSLMISVAASMNVAMMARCFSGEYLARLIE